MRRFFPDATRRLSSGQEFTAGFQHTWHTPTHFFLEGNCFACSTLSLLSEIYQEEVYERVFQIKKGDKIMDVGAHVGLFTVKAVESVGEEGLICSIEPDPKNAAMLVENVKNAALENVVLVRKAAWSTKGTTTLFLSDFSGAILL